MTGLLNAWNAIPATDSFGKYHEALQMLCGSRVSGVYAFFAESRGNPTSQCLYVGESHTGNLYDTITRHFRRWKLDPANDSLGRRRGGTTYDRNRVYVAWATLPAKDAADVQYLEIQRLQPRDNAIDGEASVSTN